MSTHAFLCVEPPGSPADQTHIEFEFDGRPETVIPFIQKNFHAILMGEASQIEARWFSAGGMNSWPPKIKKGVNAIDFERKREEGSDLSCDFIYELTPHSFMIRRPGSNQSVDPYEGIESETYVTTQIEKTNVIREALEGLEKVGIEDINNPGQDVFLDLPIDLDRSDYDEMDVDFAEMTLRLGAPISAVEKDALSNKQGDSIRKRFAMDADGPAFWEDAVEMEDYPYQTGEILEADNKQVVAKITYHFPLSESEVTFYSKPFDPLVVNQARRYAINKGLPWIYLDPDKSEVSFFKERLSIDPADSSFNEAFDNMDQAVEETLLKNYSSFEGITFESKLGFSAAEPLTRHRKHDQADSEHSLES